MIPDSNVPAIHPAAGLPVAPASGPVSTTTPEAVLSSQATPSSPVPDTAQTGQDAAIQPPQGREQAEQPTPNAEPPGQHPAPAPDNTIKVPEEPRPCEEQCQSDPSPPLEFWNGRKLLTTA